MKKSDTRMSKGERYEHVFLQNAAAISKAELPFGYALVGGVYRGTAISTVFITDYSTWSRRFWSRRFAHF